MYKARFHSRASDMHKAYRPWYQPASACARTAIGPSGLDSHRPAGEL